MSPLALTLLLAFQDAPAAAEAPEVSASVDVAFFETRVRPLLAARCLECHGPEQQKSGLRLDTRAGMLAGGERGAALVPGDPDASLLLRAVSYADPELAMPPKERLAEDEVADLVAWIASGAPAPDEEAVAAVAGDGFDFEGRARHWSYQPLEDPVVPVVTGTGWVRDPLDAFVLARLEAAGLAPAPETIRRTLLRRVTFDLTGLPPTPEELVAFEEDARPDAYARVVDRLLASPRFGETWARHWLDLVRYAETKGHEFDFPIPNAYQYRDYVIRALNADVPYDQFVREHVAGDLLSDPRRHPDEGFDESVLGTGFWFLGEEVHSPVDVRGDQVERMAGQIDVFSKAFLAQTVACARCHDHKFDPIRQTDYYALAGFLKSSSYQQVPLTDPIEVAARRQRLRVAREQSASALRGQVGEALQASTATFAERLVRAEIARRAPAAEPEADASPDARGDAPEVDPLVAELERASKNPFHPLHPSTRIGDVPGDELPEDLESAWRAHGSLQSEFLREAVLLSNLVQQGTDDAQVSASFLGVSAEHLPTSSLRFRGPWKNQKPPWEPGAVDSWRPPLVPDEADPLGRIFPRHVLSPDPLEDRLWTSDAEPEPGEVKWRQAGRVFRSPSFVLEHGRIAWLVRGQGHVFAVVDGHRMISGPLHRNSVRTFDTAGALAWVTQDLTDYVGAVVQLEITPSEGHALELFGVVDASSEPPLPGDRNAEIAALVAEADLSSLESLAAAYAEHFRQVFVLFAEEGLGAPGQPDAVGRLELAAWYLEHAADDVTLPAEDYPGLEGLDEPLVVATAPALWDGSGVDEELLARGSHHSPRDVVPRRFLEVLGGTERGPLPSGPTSRSGRERLAEELADPANPLLARVQVNRLWQHLFGRGLVTSVDDFGRMGEEPTHPALLDHLATRFVASGWSNKTLLRALVLSATYRMSSGATAAALELDPANRLYHAAEVRRLEGEKIRDAILAVSGRLDETLYGPSVPLHLTEFLDGRGKPAASGPLDGAGRRSLYLSVRRNFPDPFLTVFDRPNPMTTVGARSLSNVPAQALALMNDPFVAAEARRWAERELELAPDTPPAQRVDAMIRRAYTRPATADEIDRAVQYLSARCERLGATPADLEVWAELAHVFLNTKEFVFLR